LTGSPAWLGLGDNSGLDNINIKEMLNILFSLLQLHHKMKKLAELKLQTHMGVLVGFNPNVEVGVHTKGSLDHKNAWFAGDSNRKFIHPVIGPSGKK
jgi:hypothetical protein